MSDDLRQPNPNREVPSVLSDSTAAPPCQHCFCRIATNGDLRCHKCSTTKPYEDPKPHTCLMCNGTGVTYPARSRDSDFESEPVL